MIEAELRGIIVLKSSSIGIDASGKPEATKAQVTFVKPHVS